MSAMIALRRLSRSLIASVGSSRCVEYAVYGQSSQRGLLGSEMRAVSECWRCFRETRRSRLSTRELLHPSTPSPAPRSSDATSLTALPATSLHARLASAASGSGKPLYGDVRDFMLDQAPPERPPAAPLDRLVVFGGSGFVGSNILKRAAARGTPVTSVSRSGRPSHLTEEWADRIDWQKGDALDPDRPWAQLLQGAKGVISTVGAFGSNKHMYRTCGEATMALIDAAADAQVPRFAFISVHDPQLPGGWHLQDFLLKGYFQGKRDAEAHLLERFPRGGIALRPWFIYGTRVMAGHKIHQEIIGWPVATAMSILPTQRLASLPIVGAMFIPPTPARDVAAAACAAVYDDSVSPGIKSVWDIQRLAEQSRGTGV